MHCRKPLTAALLCALSVAFAAVAAEAMGTPETRFRVYLPLILRLHWREGVLPTISLTPAPQTATQTATHAASATPSWTASPSLTATLTHTTTPTPSHTASATPSDTPTGTATPTLPLGPRVRIVPQCGEAPPPWCSQFDAPGDDNANRNEEYVCFQNQGGEVANLLHWRVKDEADTTYTFPPFALHPGGYVRLRTGSGTDTATDLYWGRGRAVWNNAGDTVYLYDALWNLIDKYTY